MSALPAPRGRVAAYGPDLACIHDVGFGGFSDRAAPGLLALLRRHGIRDGLVVDLGCGSGRWARTLTDSGYGVLGIDASPSMIALARRKAPRARFRVGSLLEAGLPLCVAVTAIGECLCYRSGGAAGLGRLFRRVHHALRPGGVFVFDVREPPGPGSPRTRRSFRLGPDWAVLLEAERDATGSGLVRRITTFRRHRRLYRRAEEVHRLRLYPAADLARRLGRAGFQARVARCYGRFRLPAGLAVLVGRKPMPSRP